MSHLVEADNEILQKSGIETPFPIYRQVYDATPLPNGSTLVKANVVAPDETGGDFFEIARMDTEGYVKSLKDKGISLRPAQVNFSFVRPGTRKFGHLHPEQDELWMVIGGTLTVGLFDIRRSSQTFNERYKVSLTKGGGVYIPHGVVHGVANYTDQLGMLLYLPNMYFSPNDDTQELRFDPSNTDPDFWKFTEPDTL